ncbi:type II toxin-antitoxin system HipA family toxin [Stenotrophomonas sp. CFBP 13725]|uniref:type II toxin-antitoxin system HipA family toxin n=1 Tax=Stenotrophomonas sp. CFBP 13725 TaxID=2775297 RepID=UPI0018DA10CE|nr:type II toxin-antitoxin system HipA family toxin [Stenotrophomonas sp. CFBP 13725]
MAIQLLDVIYEGWGEQWSLGRLADDGERLLFQYSSEALEEGFALSPNLPLVPEAFQGYDDYQYRLPGAIADALPDGWGLLVMDRLFRKRGRDPRRLSPLDRLAFIGDRAMGALNFRPQSTIELGNEDLSLLELAAQVQDVVHDNDASALVTLARLGGSPQGARPKVLVDFEPRTDIVSTQPLPGGEPWLVKFQAGNEHPELCAVEALYAQLALQCGIEMPDTRHFELGPKLAAFGIRRFDRHDGMRVPMLTLAGAADLNFRIPQIDYSGFLRLTRSITRSQAEVDRAFRRAVFNVVFNNQDDHSKNFSFRLDRDRDWKLAPGYDLTFSWGPGSEHHMDVYGEGREISRSHLLKLAQDHDVPKKDAEAIIALVCDVATRFADLAQDYPIRRMTRLQIGKVIGTHLSRMR